MKSKIAISIDASLLRRIDARIDHKLIRSRSQAIEYFITKGMEGATLSTAIILLAGDDITKTLRLINDKTLIKNQVQFLKKHNVSKIIVVTQEHKDYESLKKETSSLPEVELVKVNKKGTASAIEALKSRLKEPFIAMFGDIFADFDLASMIRKHHEFSYLGTVGIMTRERPTQFGAVTVDGDLITKFEEKPMTASSHVVNGGIYIFSPDIFNLFDKNTKSLEKDLLPKLATQRKLQAFFISGYYIHFE